MEKGFDWMGFWFTEKGCDGVASRALQNFKDRLRRLYERVRQWPEDLRHCRMAGYVRAWYRWTATGLLSGSAYKLAEALPRPPLNSVTANCRFYLRYDQ
ncbi:hypothetical protein DUV77_26440 [Salmonella enterica subsp. enterica serovar Newport]|nr:hypothetical protein [Salmonella enterica subsp. enterica serovar Newport]EBW9127924.1 hypothetical protein [Salmonella enterica subsp. enterica serovar Newport]